MFFVWPGCSCSCTRPNALRLTQKAFVGIVHYIVNDKEQRLDREFSRQESSMR
jgi:hypothetical protein